MMAVAVKARKNAGVERKYFGATRGRYYYCKSARARGGGVYSIGEMCSISCMAVVV